ncbi:hypothetical protein BTM25_09960 [Actinomadura rubteroloni]|uniref:Uncharacterized protein n=1 Tax=Actinomadura rubteroloni TaxID=1926885 RepID=A0A2P4UNG3_9ACTN|nr:hypothetical protein [Actinomadura rubteroloni]POM26594.1 hypothetical protein BTM25_09960 [Actinomadura rubteroloni]
MPVGVLISLLKTASAMAVAIVAFCVVWLVLGVVALMKARSEDIPATVRALARWGRR